MDGKFLSKQTCSIQNAKGGEVCNDWELLSARWRDV